MDENVTQNGEGFTPENTQNDNNMASLLENEGLGIDFPTQGEIRTGVIASITPGRILVSVGTKSEGIIEGKEYELIPSDELVDLKLGQEIPVFVVNPEDSNGNLILSYMRAREEESWAEVEKLLASKDATHSTIIGYNKGGLIVPIGGLRGFVPASQISMLRRNNTSGDTPEQRWGKMIGEEIDICVIEVDRERRRLILSERAATAETRESVRERVLEELNEGSVYSGRITSIADFGIFVNINGADGLVHMSEISWDRIQHPSELFKIGQEVKVKVINIDHEKKRIGLSIRQMQDDPWEERVAQFQVGKLVEGTITRLTKFGAFARLTDDIEGLIHISEISDRRIEHPKEVLKEGDVCTLRIIKVDPGVHRIGLSLRRVDSMAYADMDWQTLEGIIIDDEQDKPVEETVETVAEQEKPVEVTEETVEATEETVEETEEMVEATEETVEATEETIEKPEDKPATDTIDEE